MELIQYNGPFTQGETIVFPSATDYAYIQIGISSIDHVPIRDLYKEPLATDIAINGDEYHINGCDILEFTDLEKPVFIIEFLHDFPMETVVDVLIDKID